MPKLYIDEYTRALAGRPVVIACREGILRDHFKSIVADIKFLQRQGIPARFLHNLPNRFANRKIVRELAKRLPETRVQRVAADGDFYREAIDRLGSARKLIILERKYLVDPKGRKINAISTDALRRTLGDVNRAIGNRNFQHAMSLICEHIETGPLDRVHILPAGHQVIKQELFTIEGAGTLIANNFTETFAKVTSEEEIRMIAGILDAARKEGFIKPRSKGYLDDHRANFFVTCIDGIVAGCVEKIIIDDQTVELGGLAISTRFRNHRIGVFTVKAFLDEMIRLGYDRFITLTNNARLGRLLERMGFRQQTPASYARRQAASPQVGMYYLEARARRS